MLTISGANTYTGTTIISGGTLSFSADNNFSTPPSSATAGSLTINGGTLSSSATFTLNSNRGIALGTSNGTIDVAASQTLTYGGIIAGSNALTIGATGFAGTLTLSGANTYTGTTTVAAALLTLPILASGSSVTVSSGATLSGTGTANGTVSVSGTISPAGSGTAGILSTGAITWAAGGTYACDILDATGTAGTGWDEINSTGFSVTATSISKFTVALGGGTIANLWRQPHIRLSGNFTGTAPSLANVQLTTTGISNSFPGIFTLSIVGNTIVVGYALLPLF